MGSARNALGNLLAATPLFYPGGADGIMITSFKRSIILLWVTGEEKGLLGSRYFAEYPTVPGRSIVANINTDMLIAIIPLQSLTIYGIGESDLGEWAAEIAKRHGIEPQDDPRPQRSIFIRSDQYSFIRKGVPAVQLDVGYKLDTPQQKLIDEVAAPALSRAIRRPAAAC